MAGCLALNQDDVGSTPTPGSMTPELLTDIFTMYADTHHQMQTVWDILEENEELHRDDVRTLVYAAFIWGIEASLRDKEMIDNLLEASKEFYQARGSDG